MERMEKWFAGLKDRPLLQAALAAGAFAVLWIFTMLYTPYAHPTYIEDEITPEVCAEILEDASRVKSEMFYIGKEPCEHRIFVGYTTTNYPDNYTEPVLWNLSWTRTKRANTGMKNAIIALTKSHGMLHCSGFLTPRPSSSTQLPAASNCRNQTGKIYWQTDPITGPEMYLFRYYGEELAVLDAGGETIR